MPLPWEEFAGTATAEEDGPWKEFQPSTPSEPDGPWKEFQSAPVEAAPVAELGLAVDDVRELVKRKVLSGYGPPLTPEEEVTLKKAQGRSMMNALSEGEYKAPVLTPEQQRHVEDVVNTPRLDAATPQSALETIRRTLTPLLGPTEKERTEEMVPWGKDEKGNQLYVYKPLGNRLEQEQGLLFTPYARVEPLPADEKDTKLTQVGKGVFNTIAGLENTFLAPGTAILPMASGVKPMGQIISGAFAADMATHAAPEQVEQMIFGKTLQEQIEGGLGAVTSTLMATAAGLHSAGKLPAKPSNAGAVAEPTPSTTPTKPAAATPAPLAEPVAVAERANATGEALPVSEAARPATTETSTPLPAERTAPTPESVRASPALVENAKAESWKQAALPDELRTSPELEAALSGAKAEAPKRGAPFVEKDFSEGGALGGRGGGAPIVTPKGATPKGDTNFIRVETAPKRLFKGLLTEGAADVLAKSKNTVGKTLAKQIRKHVDVEQELTGQLTAEIDRATKGMSKVEVKNALTELEPYLAAKENKRPLPAISPKAQSILAAWENIAEKTGLISEAHGVQVFDPTTGSHRPMHRIGRAYVPRVFKPEVQKVLSDPRTNPKLFNDLANDLAAHRKITPEEAATELRGVAGRFQSSDFMGNLEMARTGQLPELFYDYNLGNIMSRYVPSFSERMAQIIAYGQRLGPREAPLRENLWDVAMKEAEDGYTQNWIRSAEDQAVNLRATAGPMKLAQQGQTLASGLLLSSPTTTVLRNMLSGTAATSEVLGVRRSTENLIKAATDAQTKLDAREIGAVRENLGDFLHADQLGETKGDVIIRSIVNKTMKWSGYNASEGFVRTHAAATASQFAKDGVKAIAKDPKSGAAKEALGLFKRLGIDAEKVVAEGADWKTGAESRKFIRTVIRETQGGYRFDMVPLWANSAVGRFFYQFGRYGVQRSRNIWNNGIKPLIGEEVQWHGKTMARRDAMPMVKMGINAVLLGEAYALVSQGFFGRDRKDASMQELTEALTEDQKQFAVLASERIINDIIMSGSLGIWGQPLDFGKSLKDQSRFKNPAEPPAMSSTKAVVKLAQNALDQEGRVTNKDLISFIGGIMPGAKQIYDLERNIFDEPLYEAENDVRTLRTAATRWASANKIDVPKRSITDIRKSANSPEYEAIQDALLVGNSDRAKMLADKFASEEKDAEKKKKAIAAVKNSIKQRQPFRVGPFTNGEYRAEFMSWASKHLPKADYEQAQRVQDRYEKAAAAAGLW